MHFSSFNSKQDLHIFSLFFLSVNSSLQLRNSCLDYSLFFVSRWHMIICLVPSSYTCLRFWRKARGYSCGNWPADSGIIRPAEKVKTCWRKKIRTGFKKLFQAGGAARYKNKCMISPLFITDGLGFVWLFCLFVFVCFVLFSVFVWSNMFQCLNSISKLNDNLKPGRKGKLKPFSHQVMFR